MRGRLVSQVFCVGCPGRRGRSNVASGLTCRSLLGWTFASVRQLNLLDYPFIPVTLKFVRVLVRLVGSLRQL